MQKKGALVIGGGIAGIQAALDLADARIKVYLIEKSSSIGGRMAQLDKTFPTNDCAMCILSPKLVAAARHPNIELMTLSEVIKVRGDAGDFKVTVRKNPRYVDINKCVGCGLCAEKCPAKVSNELDLGLKERKAIYTPFAQAVPLKYSIDSLHCIYFKTGKCKICVKTCVAEAIDFEQKAEDIELNVGTIIVATGYDQQLPTRKEYGYSVYENVLTSLQFERLLNAAGPTGGRIFRPSDKTVPKTILFAQCIGSRDINGYLYCSRVCCMYSIKEAVIAQEHEPSITKSTILYMDIRAFGKGFEEYYQRVGNKIEFIRGRLAEISEAENRGLIVRFENTKTSEIKELQVDLVVLSSAIIPSPNNKNLAKILNLELDENGFFKEKHVTSDSVLSTIDGIYLCGCATGPKDIPESVITANAAAALAAKSFLDARVVEDGKLEAQPLDVSGELKIGVFVCHCGINIAGTVDVKKVKDYAATLPNVVYTEDNLFTCSENSQSRIQHAIKEYGLNRIVVAACTPRTHEPIFKDTCYKAGLNPYLFEMANIRDQCSWVHPHDKNRATRKAMDLVRMAVAKVRLLEPLESLKITVTQSALVIGGGISGISAAIALSEQGLPTYLIEKEEKLGGRLRELSELAPTMIQARELIDKKLELLKNSKVKVYTTAKIEKIDGFVGNFEIRISYKGKEENFKVGAIVLAIGAELYNPKEYGYGKFQNVITNMELEKLLVDKEFKWKGKKPKSVSFIQCVGARELDGYTGCSRYCCNVAIKQAIALRKSHIAVNIIHRDIRTYSKGAEELYQKASELGVNFFRYSVANKPDFDSKKIKLFDELSDEILHLPTDLLVLSIPMIPNESEILSLQKLIKIPRSSDGFFLELHPKLGPVETNTDGIYLAGCCQSPKDTAESILSGLAAASKAATILSKTEIQLEPIVAAIEDIKCRGCGKCEEVCEFNAITSRLDTLGNKVFEINQVLCKGCGSCAAECPTGAITAKGFTQKQITEMVKVAMEA